MTLIPTRRCRAATRPAGFSCHWRLLCLLVMSAVIAILAGSQARGIIAYPCHCCQGFFRPFFRSLVPPDSALSAGGAGPGMARIGRFCHTGVTITASCDARHAACDTYIYTRMDCLSSGRGFGGPPTPAGRFRAEGRAAGDRGRGPTPGPPTSARQTRPKPPRCRAGTLAKAPAKSGGTGAEAPSAAPRRGCQGPPARPSPRSRLGSGEGFRAVCAPFRRCLDGLDRAPAVRPREKTESRDPHRIDPAPL